MRLFILLIPVFLFASSLKIEQLFNVTTVKVKKVKKSLQKEFYGILKKDQKNIFSITPRFSGYVEKLYADEKYKRVKKGEVLAKVYSPEVFSAKEEYKNSINYGKNRQMIKALRKKLYLLKIDPSEIKEIQTKPPSIYTFIKAPKSGYIFEKNVFEGSYFGKTKPIFKIVSLKTLYIEAKIPQEDINEIKKAQIFEVFIPSLKKRYKAKNTLLYPLIDKKTALMTLRAQIKNDGDLIEGMYAILKIKQREKEYLILPKTAVIRKNGKWYAFKKGEFEGEFEAVEVSIKPLDDENYQIVKGLKQNDEVANKLMFLIDSDIQINGMYP